MIIISYEVAPCLKLGITLILGSYVLSEAFLFLPATTSYNFRFWCCTDRSAEQGETNTSGVGYKYRCQEPAAAVGSPLVFGDGKKLVLSRLCLAHSFCVYFKYLRKPQDHS